MHPTHDMLPLWVAANAWREIFARVFGHTEEKTNVSPEWLVNPATNRHLKLDLLYPEIGVAVRFEGLQGSRRRSRLSLEEEEQEHTRQTARIEMCRAHGVELIVILPDYTPPAVFRAVDMALSRVSQRATKAAVRQKINQARAAAADLARRVKTERDLALYADLWQDRQYQTATPPASTTAPARSTVRFKVGMEVEHTIFGPGVITAVTASGDDTMLAVDFITAGPKTLAASLVGDKLAPRGKINKS